LKGSDALKPLRKPSEALAAATDRYQFLERFPFSFVYSWILFGSFEKLISNKLDGIRAELNFEKLNVGQYARFSKKKFIDFSIVLLNQLTAGFENIFD